LDELSTAVMTFQSISKPNTYSQPSPKPQV